MNKGIQKNKFFMKDQMWDYKMLGSIFISLIVFVTKIQNIEVYLKNNVTCCPLKSFLSFQDLLSLS